MRSLIAIISTFILTSLFCVSAFAQSCGSGGGATVCLSATGTSTSINLSWTVTGSISSVQVYRDTDSNPNGRSRIAAVNSNIRSYTDTTAQAGTQYWYWIKFKAGSGSYNSGAATASLASSCAGTAITPYIYVNGVWQLTSSVQINSGTEIKLGPQPGGTWSWSGCGLSGSEREQTFTPTSSCTATAVYTNACGASTSHSFNISATVGNNWANVKMGGGGYVPGVIYHPTVANLRYARTDVAGVYRWNNNNSQWVAITDGFGPDDGVRPGAESVAVDPSNENWVAMTTNMTVWEGNGKFVYSNDQGNSWSKVNLPFPIGSNNQGRAIGERMVVDPNLPSTIFYATRTAGLWKSTDKGLTWNQVSSLSSYVMTTNDMENANGGSPIGVEFVVFDTTVPTTGFTPSGVATKTIYIGVAPDYKGLAGLSSYMYKSIDGGATWTGITIPAAVTNEITSGLHTPHLARAADGMLYVPFTSGSGPASGAPSFLYKFDGGTTWTQLTRSTNGQPGVGSYYGGIGGLSVYGSGASTKVAFGVSGTWGDGSWIQIAMRSADGGQTWAEIGRSGDVSGSHNYHDATGTTGAAKPEYWGWVDDLDIDPFDPEHISYVVGGGVWSTNEAFSTPLPHWTFDVNGIEEMVNLTMTAPPPGAGYVLASGQGDTGFYVHTSLSSAPTRSPNLGAAHLWEGGNGTGIDMAWNNPAFIAAVGTFSNKSAGAYSTDSGQTWTLFPSTPSFAATNASDETRVAVTADGANIIWAIRGQVPHYSTNKGSTWVATNLPAAAVAYHIKADRKNPLKVYAYEHGGNWWYSNPAKFYYSMDGGHTFTASAQTWSPNGFNVTDMTVNPFAEGDIWLADAHNLWHSINSGVTWTKFTAMASTGVNLYSQLGVTEVALGAPAVGSAYSAAVYFVGRIGGVYGIYRSNDAGSSWARIDDDNHRYSGVSGIVADTSVYGRVLLAGRGMLYNY